MNRNWSDSIFAMNCLTRREKNGIKFKISAICELLELHVFVNIKNRVLMFMHDLVFLLQYGKYYNGSVVTHGENISSC